MAEAICLNMGKKMSLMLLKQNNTSNLKIQEILYNKTLAILASTGTPFGIVLRIASAFFRMAVDEPKCLPV